MKFDSKTYLMSSIKTTLYYNEEYYAGILDGFDIVPGSIQYDKKKELLTLQASLPNSELKVRDIAISQTKGICMRFSVKDLDFNVNFSTIIGDIRYSVINQNEENNCAGIYYYDSSVLDKSKFKMRGSHSFYDAQTLKTLCDSYLSGVSALGITLQEVVDYTPEKIESLGFVPDVHLWEDIEFHQRTFVEVATDFNTQLKEINYDDVMNKIKSISEKIDSSVDTVVFKKKFK